MSEFSELLIGELAAAGQVKLSAEQISTLEGHYEALCLWNRRLNLTAIRTLGKSVRRHYVECLHFAAHVRALSGQLGLGAGAAILDLGSGAGFPGIPMAVFDTAWRVRLIESDQRKAVFLREASRRIANIEVQCRRSEDYTVRGDLLVSRAVRAGVVLGEVPRLAGSVALLCSLEGSEETQRDTRFRWLPPVQLPGAETSVALFGSFSG